MKVALSVGGDPNGRVMVQIGEGTAARRVWMSPNEARKSVVAILAMARAVESADGAGVESGGWMPRFLLSFEPDGARFECVDPGGRVFEMTPEIARDLAATLCTQADDAERDIAARKAAMS